MSVKIKRAIDTGFGLQNVVSRDDGSRENLSIRPQRTAALSSDSVSDKIDPAEVRIRLFAANYHDSITATPRRPQSLPACGISRERDTERLSRRC
jgi:hypothetical protein